MSKGSPSRRRKPCAKGRKKATELQHRFVDAYMGIAEGNGTKAARIAGYAGDDNVLAVTASQLLRNPKILDEIDRRRNEDPVVATRRERQRFWSNLMLGKGRFSKAAMKDRLKASELLGKSQADFVERVEHGGKVDGPPSLTVVIGKSE